MADVVYETKKFPESNSWDYHTLLRVLDRQTFSESKMSDSALSSRPKYDQLIELLDTLVSWQKFGTFLPGIKSEHIQVIECENRRIDQQKSALLTKWLSVHPEASWQDVTSALEKAQERYLATEIYQKLNALHQLMLQSPTIPSTSQGMF